MAPLDAVSDKIIMTTSGLYLRGTVDGTVAGGVVVFGAAQAVAARVERCATSALDIVRCNRSAWLAKSTTAQTGNVLSDSVDKGVSQAGTSRVAVADGGEETRERHVGGKPTRRITTGEAVGAIAAEVAVRDG